MSEYLLTLLGIILLSVLIDIILPSGSISKYISGIFAIVVMFVMINPIIKFVKRDYNINDFFSKSDITLNQNLLYSINDNKFNALEKQIVSQLHDNGYNNIQIDIRFNIDADNVEITQVLVDLSNLVINENSANINKYVYIRQVVTSNLAVAEEVVVFSG